MPSPCSHMLTEEEEEEKGGQPQQEGFLNELPDGWGMLASREGHSYYVFYPTGKTQWERPVFSPKDESKLDNVEPPPLPPLSYEGIDRVEMDYGNLCMSGQMDGMGEVDVQSMRDIRSKEDGESSHEVVPPQTDYDKSLHQALEGAVKSSLSPSDTPALEERKWPEKGKEQGHEAISGDKVKNEEGEKGEDSSLELQEDIPVLHGKDGKSRSMGPCLESPVVAASEQYSKDTECIDSSGLGGTKEGMTNSNVSLKNQWKWHQLKQEEEQTPEHHLRPPVVQIDEQMPPPPPPPAHTDEGIFVHGQHVTEQQQALKGEKLQPLEQREGKKNDISGSLRPPRSTSNWVSSSPHQASGFQQYQQQQYNQDQQQLSHMQPPKQQTYYQQEPRVHSGQMPVPVHPDQVRARSSHSSLQQEETWQEPPQWQQWERVPQQPQVMPKHGSGKTNGQMHFESPLQHQYSSGPPAVGTCSYWTMPRARQQQQHGGFSVGEEVPQQQGSQQGAGYTNDPRRMKYAPPNSYWTSSDMQQSQHSSPVVGSGMRTPYQQYTSPVYANRPTGRFWNLVKNDVVNGKDLLSSTHNRVASSAAVAGANFASAAYRIGSKVKGTVSSISRSMATFLDGGQEEQLHEGLGGENFMRMQNVPQPKRFCPQDQHYQPRQFLPTQDQSGRRWANYAADTKAARPVRFQSGQSWVSSPSQLQQKHAGTSQVPTQYPTGFHQDTWQQQHPTDDPRQDPLQYPIDDSHQGPPQYISDPQGGSLPPPPYVHAEQQQQHPSSNQGGHGGPFQYPPGIRPRGQQQQQWPQQVPPHAPST